MILCPQNELRFNLPFYLKILPPQPELSFANIQNWSNIQGSVYPPIMQPLYFIKLTCCVQSYWSWQWWLHWPEQLLIMKFLVLKVSCETVLKCLFLLILFLIYVNVFLYLFKDKISQEKDKFDAEFLYRRTNTGDRD